jgi:hypothetical protein
VPIPGGTETYVLCRSTARRDNELAIRSRFSTRLEARLRGLERRVASGRMKDRAKIERTLGRQAAYPQVADEHGPLRLPLATHRGPTDGGGMHARGAYLLRPNLTGQTAEELWTKYIQLTEAEAAFRMLKASSRFGRSFIACDITIPPHLEWNAECSGRLGGVVPGIAKTSRP